MSQTCALTLCNRTARAQCHCCRQNVCLVHLNEHNDVLNDQLNPLTEILHTLGNRIQMINIDEAFATTRKQLEQWRTDAHRQIDQYYENKYHELNHLIQDKINEQQDKFVQTQAKINELIREQQVTRQDIVQLTSTIECLENQINNFEKYFIDLQIQPLNLESNLIQIRGINEDEYNLSQLSSVYQIINLPDESYAAMATNDQYLLIHQQPHLCLVNQDLTIYKSVSWKHGDIHDMCWSSTLNRFLIIDSKYIYLLNTNTMLIDKITSFDKQKWMSCACSDEFLYLSTNQWGSSITKISFDRTTQLGKQYQSPQICHADEYIDMITCKKTKIALIIRNSTSKSIRLELRTEDKLQQIWTCVLDIQWKYDKPFHCCPFISEDWLVADYQTGRLIQISRSGRVKSILKYNTIPFCVTRFGPNNLALSTENGIHFHEVNYKKTYTIYIL